jgi:hypothetical protein
MSRCTPSCLAVGLVIAALGCGPKGGAPQTQKVAPAAQETPPFHGLFVYAATGYSSYLLIMPDGIACTVSLNDGTPAQVKAVFRCDAPDIAKGRYQITGDTLRFSSVDASGTIDWEVVRTGNDLQVKTHSQINDGRFENTYVRVP